MAAALRVPGLDPTTKLVLIGIANHDGDGGAWPAIDTLCGYAGASRRTVQRCIAKLVELGLVTVHVNDGGTAKTRNDRRPNRYDVHLDGASPVAPRPVSRGATGDRTGCHSRDTRTVLEPSIPSPSEKAGQSDAQLIANAYWDYVKDLTGKPPVGIGNQALRKMVEPALSAGYTPVDVKHALKAMYENRRPFTRQVLEEHLDGRADRPRVANASKFATGSAAIAALAARGENT